MWRRYREGHESPPLPGFYDVVNKERPPFGPTARLLYWRGQFWTILRGTPKRYPLVTHYWSRAYAGDPFHEEVPRGQRVRRVS